MCQQKKSVGKSTKLALCPPERCAHATNMLIRTEARFPSMHEITVGCAGYLIHWYMLFLVTSEFILLEVNTAIHNCQCCEAFRDCHWIVLRLQQRVQARLQKYMVFILADAEVRKGIPFDEHRVGDSNLA